MTCPYTEARSHRDKCIYLADEALGNALEAAYRLEKCEQFFEEEDLEGFIPEFRKLESEAYGANLCFDRAKDNVRSIWEIVTRVRNGATQPTPNDAPYVAALAEADRFAMRAYADATYTTALLSRGEALLAELMKEDE